MTLIPYPLSIPLVPYTLVLFVSRYLGGVVLFVVLIAVVLVLVRGGNQSQLLVLGLTLGVRQQIAEN